MSVTSQHSGGASWNSMQNGFSGGHAELQPLVQTTTLSKQKQPLEEVDEPEEEPDEEPPEEEELDDELTSPEEDPPEEPEEEDELEEPDEVLLEEVLPEEEEHAPGVTDITPASWAIQLLL